MYITCNSYEEAILASIKKLAEIDNYICEVKIYPKENKWVAEFENNNDYAEREV